LDLYLGSKKIAKQICKSVRSRYGGDLLDSAKLVGEKDGKKNYRITHSLRLPKFLIDDIISYEGNIIQIKKIGKKITGRDLSTGKTIMLEDNKDKIRRMKKVGSIEESAETDLIAATGNEIQVLDPDTDEIVTIPKPYFIDDFNKNKITVIKTDSGLIALSATFKEKK
jgi:nonsense-mediated mRNA decay protein 3